MPDTRSEDTLMALLALDTEDFSDELATATPEQVPVVRRLPTLDERIAMFVSAIHGSDRTVTVEMRARAREHVLAAMAADLVDETTDFVPGAEDPSIPPAQPTNVEAGAKWSGDLSRFLVAIVGVLQRAISSVAAIFTMPVLRMAAVPLAALLVVGSVWSGNWLNSNEPSEPLNGPTSDAPKVRSFGTSEPVDTAAEQNLEHAIAAEEAKHGAANPAVARKLVDLASLFREDGRYDEAEKLCARALAIQQPVLGAKSPDTLRTLEELALVYRAQGRGVEADQLLRQAGQP